MLKRIAAGLALLLCLSSCHTAPEALSQPEAPPSASAAEPEEWVPQPTQEWVFAISRDAPQSLRTAADYFCTEVSRITQERINFTVRDSIAPDADLVAGRAQVAFLNKKRQLAFSPPLAATAYPFLYSGYKNFTMRANAPAVLESLESSLRQHHGMVPLGAYYQGALHLLTDFPAGDYRNYLYSMIATTYDPEMEQVIARLEGEAVVVDSESERFEMFWIGEVTGIEISLKELSKYDELPSLSYLTVSSHNIVPAWLVVSESFYDSLPPAQQAGMAEICAYMTNLIDDEIAATEAEQLADLSIANLVISTELSGVRNRVYNTMPALGEGAAPEQFTARDLMDRMRRIA